MNDAVDIEGPPAICHRCGAVLTAGDGSFYVVRIEAFADPTPPRDAGDAETVPADLDDLLRQMSDMSERELMDQVYRRLTITLCRRCYSKWIEHPTG